MFTAPLPPQLPIRKQMKARQRKKYLMRIPPMIGLIVTLNLYNFIVETDDQPRRNPLRDKISRFPCPATCKAK